LRDFNISLFTSSVDLDLLDFDWLMEMLNKEMQDEELKVVTGRLDNMMPDLVSVHKNIYFNIDFQPITSAHYI